MENETSRPIQERENEYAPRPSWQVWAARLALVLFLIVLFFYYRSILSGGI